MGIGYLLLYAALAVVALWLVAELLLQNRAPLHWRGLALVGFLAVAGGMAMGSVPVIGGGAAMFAVGQTFVTLSVKRGYGAGWSLRRADGSLPGPLAKVPLLGALTGGGAVAAAAVVAAERVGEVGAVEEARPAADSAPRLPEEAPVEQTAAFEMQELAADGVYAAAYYEQQQTEVLHAVENAQAAPQQDAYAEAYQGGYDPAQQQLQQQAGQYGYEQQQQQWQAQQQPVFGYDQGYGGYQQQDPYGGYQQQPDPYAAYQQQPQQHEQQQHDPQHTGQYGYEQQQQQWQAQQQPDQQHPTGIPQQPQYDQYGYQQQPTWQQHQG
ncbi:hypothetical protein [Streptomyces sp. NRRL S-495]|uniref:hypothetical protein n=1 Tax=Streptomyces sp. NRRL S-495 TaxID=1609133 RepID=UPI0005F899BA|nr:hypothetical protein [Streptomyces sp. NRRL S-495]KJY39183.1 hypothetical protein VR45_03605 [Streptomyces sp. NRRL S-495]